MRSPDFVAALLEMTGLKAQELVCEDLACSPEEALTAMVRLREGLKNAHPGVEFHPISLTERVSGMVIAGHVIEFLQDTVDGPCPLMGCEVNQVHFSFCPVHEDMLVGLVHSFMTAANLEVGNGFRFLEPYLNALSGLRECAEQIDILVVRPRTAEGVLVNVPYTSEYQRELILHDADVVLNTVFLLRRYASWFREAMFRQFERRGTSELSMRDVNEVRRHFFKSFQLEATRELNSSPTLH